MAFSLTCPKCHAILRSASQVAAGKKVRCPKCDTSFEAPPLEEVTAVTAAPSSPAPRREGAPAADAGDSDTDIPRKKRRNHEQDDEPRSTPSSGRNKTGMGAAKLLGVLLVAGAMVAVAFCGCSGLGYWVYTLVYAPHPIVGTWEQTNHPLGLKVINTFGRDGLGSTKMANVQISYKYRLDGNMLEVEPDQAVQLPFAKGIHAVERYTVDINGDDMVLTAIGNPFLFGQPEQRFRRVR